MLFSMCWLDRVHFWVPFIVAAWLLRTAFVSCSQPLTNSVIMDLVPKVIQG